MECSEGNELPRLLDQSSETQVGLFGLTELEKALPRMGSLNERLGGLISGRSSIFCSSHPNPSLDLNNWDVTLLHPDR